MKIEYNLTKYKKIISKTALRFAAIVTIIQLLIGFSLISPQSIFAVQEKQTVREQRPGGIYKINPPHIVQVATLKETKLGQTEQEIAISGHNFSTQKEKNKIFILRQSFDSSLSRPQGSKIVRSPRYDVVAIVEPFSASAGGLRGRLLTRLLAGEYFIQVEVTGVGKGNIKQVEVLKTRIAFQPRRKLEITISEKSAKPKEEINVHGNFLQGYQYHIWFYYQADRKYRYPLIITRKDDSYLRGVLPEHAKPGLYDVHVGGGDTRRESPTFGTHEESNTIPFMVEAVSPDYFHQFEIEFIGFECFKESADGPGSDEVYMTGLVYRDDLRDKYTPQGTSVYDSVDAGDKRMEPQRFLTFGKTIEDHPYDQERRRYGLDKFIIVVALGEYDGDARWHRTRVPAFQIAKSAAHVLFGNGSRTQMIEKVKNSLRKTIDDASDFFSEDDCLGIEELTFTKEELQKAVYLNGRPLEKSLHYRGDDSHYRAIFHLKLAR
jgi:hypothetical protein